MSDWTARCVLCTARGKVTRLDSGHACPACMGWLASTLADIGHLVADAAACLVPAPGTGSGSRPVPGSRPPIDLDAVDPELALIELNAGDSSSAVPILEMLEMWCRAIREDRQLSPYGPASRISAIEIGGASSGTSVTLIGCTAFLGRQVPWMATEPTFPLEEFADHIRRAKSILYRWDPNRRGATMVVPCPTLDDNGADCGYPLPLEGDDSIWCRRCGRQWDPSRLVRVVSCDPGVPDVWVDADAVAEAVQVTAATVRRWAKSGRVGKRNSLYRLRDAVAVAGLGEGKNAG